MPHEIHRAVFRGVFSHTEFRPGRPQTGIYILSHNAVLGKRALCLGLIK